MLLGMLPSLLMNVHWLLLAESIICMLGLVCVCRGALHYCAWLWLWLAAWLLLSMFHPGTAYAAFTLRARSDRVDRIAEAAKVRPSVVISIYSCTRCGALYRSMLTVVCTFNCQHSRWQRQTHTCITQITPSMCTRRISEKKTKKISVTLYCFSLNFYRATYVLRVQLSR